MMKQIKKQWKLKCSACDDDIYTIAGTEYASIDDLISKAKQNNTNNNTCTCNALRIGIEEISQSELDAYYVKNPVVLSRTCAFIENESGEIIIKYTDLTCYTCGNKILESDEKLEITVEHMELLDNILYCSNCKHKFTEVNILVRRIGILVN